MDFNTKHKYLIQILPFSEDFYIDEEMNIYNVSYIDRDVNKRDYYLENMEKIKNGVKFTGNITESYYPFMLLENEVSNNVYYKLLNIETKEVIVAPVSHVRILRNFTKDEEELSKMLDTGMNIENKKNVNAMDEILNIFESGMNINQNPIKKNVKKNSPIIDNADKSIFYNGVRYDPEDDQYVENLKRSSRKRATSKLPKLKHGVLKSGVLKTSNKIVTKKNVEKNDEKIIKKVEKKTKRNKK